VLSALAVLLAVSPVARAEETGRLRIELLLKGLECLKTTSGLGDDSIFICTATVNLANGRSFVSWHAFWDIGADQFQGKKEATQGIGGFWPVKDINDIVVLALVAEKDYGSAAQFGVTKKEIERRLKDMLPKLKHQYTWQNRPRDQVVKELRDAISEAWRTREKKQDDLIAITELRVMPEDISTTQIKKKLKRHPAVGDGGAFALHIQVTSGPFEHQKPGDDKKDAGPGGTWQGSPGMPGGGQPGGGQSPGAPVNPRDHWVHSAGSFRMIGGNKWNEYDANGAVKFSYVETQRTPDFVELYDASREGFARLYADRAMGKHPLLSGNQWIDVLKGSWKKSAPGQGGGQPGGNQPGGPGGGAQKPRTHWAYAGGHVQHVGGKKWQEHQGGKLHATFTEQERTDEYIQLYNAKASLWIRLTDKAMHLFQGHNRDAGWQEYRGGQWTK
jgi:hypothetical protein